MPRYFPIRYTQPPPTFATLAVAEALHAHAAESSPVAGGGGDVVHGDLVNITGSGFGTRGDYNHENYTFMGERHIHALFGYFDAALPADGSSQATFRAALNGMYPASTFAFNSNPSSSLSLSLQNGGPSQSGRFLRKTSSSFAESGYLMIDTGSTTANPANPYAYMSFLHRGSGDGKIMRWWQDGSGSSGENWYIGGTALVSEGTGAPTGWYQNFTRSSSTFERYEIFLRESNASVMKVDGTTILLSSSNFTTMHLVDSANYSSRNLLLSWPNSVDSGGSFDTTDIYYDFTEARVIASQGGVEVIQPVKSWADGVVEIIFNKGSLSAGSATLTVYGSSSSVLGTQSITVQ